MAINVTDETVKTLQALVHDAFETNAILDRVKTVMTTTLAFPVFGNFVHMLAHRYAINIGDGVGDLLEDYNEPVEYGNIPIYVSNYSDIQSAIDAVYNAVLTYQNELNQSAKVAFDNMDTHIYEGLLEIIEEHNKYVKQVILWKDITDRYKDSPSLDVHSEHYNILGE
jgi:hypothetical protein